MAKLEVPRVRLHQIGDNDPGKGPLVAPSLRPYAEPPLAPLSVKAGDRRTVSAVWRKETRECELVYEDIIPGRRVIGIGHIGSITVKHLVEHDFDDFYAEVDGPEALDQGRGGWFGMSQDGASLQLALNFLAMRIECVRAWCEAVGKKKE